LDSLSSVNQDVRSGVLRAERPDFHGVVLVPVERFFHKSLGSLLDVVLLVDFSSFDGVGQFVSQWQGFNEESVVLVWGFS